MTPSKKQTNYRKRREWISNLILGMWSSIINAPEIKKLFPYKERKKFNKRRLQIVECAAGKFINKHNGYKYLKKSDKKGVRRFIILSVIACI